MYKDLKELIDSVDSRNFEGPLGFRGAMFNIFESPYDEDDEDDNPAIWEISGADSINIYICPETIGEEFRKSVLMNLMAGGLYTIILNRKPKVDSGQVDELAYKIARGFDDRYSRETMSREQLERYSELRERFSA